MAANCRGCGRPIPNDSVFCPYCGHNITGKMIPARQQAQTKSGMNTGTIIAIIVVVIVVIPIVLAAALYFMVLGFASSSISTPSAVYAVSSESVTNGVKIEVWGITSSEVPWGDVKVWLTDGTYFAEWSPRTKDLDTGSWTLVRTHQSGRFR